MTQHLIITAVHTIASKLYTIKCQPICRCFRSVLQLLGKWVRPLGEPTATLVSEQFILLYYSPLPSRTLLKVHIIVNMVKIKRCC